MSDYIDREKLINDGIAKGFCDWYDEIKHAQKEDVVEQEKIDKAIKEITRLRDSTERMITEEVSVQNECYEQYVNCFDECLKIIKQNIGE